MSARMEIRHCPRHKKKCYPTQAAAIRFALRYSRLRGTALRPYYDTSCQSWHLTKKAKR